MLIIQDFGFPTHTETLETDTTKSEDALYQDYGVTTFTSVYFDFIKYYLGSQYHYFLTDHPPGGPQTLLVYQGDHTQTIEKEFQNTFQSLSMEPIKSFVGELQLAQDIDTVHDTIQHLTQSLSETDQMNMSLLFSIAQALQQHQDFEHAAQYCILLNQSYGALSFPGQLLQAIMAHESQHTEDAIQLIESVLDTAEGYFPNAYLLLAQLYLLQENDILYSHAMSQYFAQGFRLPIWEHIPTYLMVLQRLNRQSDIDTWLTFLHSLAKSHPDTLPKHILTEIKQFQSAHTNMESA